MSESSRWVGGSCLCAIGRCGVALVTGDSRGLVEKLWDQLRTGTDLATLLQLMAAEYAADLMNMPPFALVVHHERGVHVALRGPVRFVALAQDERVDIDAGNVVTWVERNLGTTQGYQLIVEEGEGEALPIADGIVRVSAVYHGALATAGAPHAAAPRRSSEAAPPSPQAHAGPQELSGEGTGAMEVGSEPAQVPVVPPAAAPMRSSELTLVPEASLTEPGLSGTETEEAQEPSGSGPVRAEEPSPQAMYYAHHWEPTRARSVEDAAVRDIRDDDRDPFAASAPPEPVQEKPQEEPVAVTLVEEPAEAEQEDHGSFFIDAVPKPGGSPAPGPAPAPLPPVPPAAPAPPEPSYPGSAASQQNVLGDHDGQTLTSARIAALRSQRAAARGETAEAPASGQVLAGFCAAGHANPPHASRCRVCGQPLTERTGMIPRPPLGRLRVSTGVVVPLNSDIIVGRAPRSTPEPGRPSPQLVPVPSPEQQISRTHCEIRVDGWDIRVLDRKSNNGTFLLRPGEAPVRIDERTPTILRAGDVLDLGENVTLMLEFD